MADLKTTKTKASAREFVSTVPDTRKRKDCQQLMKLMHRVTGKRAAMWGGSIVGYGNYRYKYESGRQGESFTTGFAPRAQNISIYIMPGFSQYSGLLNRLGKHKLGRSCLYIKQLTDIDEDVLSQLITESVTEMHQLYECW